MVALSTNDITLSSLQKTMPHYVYTLAYPESMGGHVFYVGKGVGKRIDDHERYARQGKRSHKSSIIRKIWACGEQVIKGKVAFFETQEEAFFYEMTLIFFMKPYGHLTNLTDGGDGARGMERTVSEDTRRKLSLINMGKSLSEETRNKMSLSLKGRIFSEEHRTHLSTANKRKSPEVYRRIAEANRGRTVSEEVRRKWSIRRKGKVPSNLSLVHERNIGRVKSEATRHKISEANKGKIFSEETRRKMSTAKKGKIPSNLSLAHEATRQRHARNRQQALQRMRYPVISPTDAEWKQGVTALSLWEEEQPAS